VAALKAALQSIGIRTISAGFNNPRASVTSQVFQRVTCPLGGQIELSGNISDSRDANGSGLIQVELRKTFTDCGFTAGGVLVILNGDPYLTMSGTLSYLNGAPATQQRLRWDGALRWRIQPGNAAGNCQANLEVNFATLSDPTPTATGAWCDPVANVRLPNAPPIGPVQPVPPPQSPAPPNVRQFDGSYGGSYAGRFAGESVSGPVAFTVSNGAITVTVPGRGSGSVDAAGSASFSGSLGVEGVSCTFSGSFQVSPSGSASASGTWSCPGLGSSGQGTWSATR
jgi:hypothetical protein